MVCILYTFIFNKIIQIIFISGIKTLLEYCKNTENKSEEEIEELYKAYEI